MNGQRRQWGHWSGWLTAVLVAWPSVIRAQRVESPTLGATLDAGIDHIGIDGFTSSYAATLSPNLSALVPLSHGMQFSGLLTTSVSRFESGNVTGNLVGDFAIGVDTISSKPSLYVEGSAATYLRSEEGNYVMTGLRWGHSDGAGGGGIPIGSAFGEALRFGAWGDLGIGKTHAASAYILNLTPDERAFLDTINPAVARNGYYIQQAQYTTQRAEAGLSARWRTWTALTSADLNQVPNRTYLDLTVGGVWRPTASVQARMISGFRIGAPTISDRRAWSDFSVVLPFVGNNALIVAAGSAPADPARATLAATYVSVSTRVRFGTLHRTTPVARMIAALNHVSAAGDMNADGSRTVTLVLPTAHTVDLMGDFTAWRPITMTRAPNGVWVTRVTLSPGSHSMNIRVDGSSWRAPPGLPVAPDDFGGVVGLLVIH